MHLSSCESPVASNGAAPNIRRGATLERVLVFLKAPVIGEVKTRLAKDLAPGVVLELYRSFVADILQTLAGSGYRTTICYYPSRGRAVVERWLGPGYAYRQQRGRDLGERMAQALASAFTEGVHRALLVGTDIPDLPAEIFEEAFAALHDSAAVLGPAFDGGYYLIGFRATAFWAPAFRNIPWGTGRVLSDTLAILNAAGLKVHLLPSWRDIDAWRDLEALAREDHGTGTTAVHTRACLARLGLGPQSVPEPSCGHRYDDAPRGLRRPGTGPGEP